MKKILSTVVLLVFTVAAAYAQRSTVTARVLDKDTGESVIGAVVTVAPVKTPDKKQMLTSGYKGMFSIPSVAYGEYTLSVTFLGYNEYKTTFKVSAVKTNLGDIRLEPGVAIETVVKEAKALRTSQHGDTVSYNAGAFKVVADADAEGLLKKMPGITISDGTVEAQGEQVKKVFVDGKEFFGEDVTTAIKSLPAQAVDRIEVYNKLSDNAEFSGMDDGEGYKAINIVTHKHMRQGKFGKIYAGVGYDFDNEKEVKYLAGGNVNIFHGDSRVSVIGLFNNINQQNFSFEDILGVTGSSGGRGGHRGVGQYMVRPQSGVASVNAFGLNYSDSWGKRKQVTFQGSYFFNNTSTINHSITERWYEAPMYAVDTLSTVGDSDTKSYNHRFNGRLEWKISKKQNLMVRPSFSYQTNDPFSTTNGWQYGESGYSRTDNMSDADRHGYTMGLYAVYRARLGQKKGRTITIDGRGSYSSSKYNSLSHSNQLGSQPVRPDWNFTDPDALKGLSEEQIAEKYEPYRDLRRLYSKAPSTSYSVRSNFTYTEPIAKYASLSLQYRFSYESSERDKDSYITGDNFSIAGLEPDPALSNSYRSTYLRHNIGPGFRWSRKRNTIVANAYYQRSTLDGAVIQSASGDPIKRDYDNLTYFMMVRWNFNRENSLRLYVRSYTDNPTVTDLQSVYDVSDEQNISRGNPELNPAYCHSIRFHYTNSNVEKGRTFMWMFSFSAISDYNATHMLQSPGEMNINGKIYTPNFYSTSVNLDGYRSLRTHLSYGFPVGFLKSNLNIMAGVTYSITPSMLGGTWNKDGSIDDGVRNDARNIGYDGRVVLGSNISENVDFTLSWGGTYNEATNAFQNEKIKNRYFNHTAAADMKFVLPLGFTISASAAYTQYIGFTNDYEDSYLLCNAWLGKKLFKNKRGELMVGVTDMFNQNKGFSRTAASGYTQNVYNSVIGRYYMVQFVYNLRHFGKKGSKNMKDYSGMERSSEFQQRRRMMGPPPGGFR